MKSRHCSILVAISTVTLGKFKQPRILYEDVHLPIAWVIHHHCCLIA